jgi:hypothetical protein
MENNFSIRPLSRKRRIIRSLVFSFLAGALTYYLFSSFGPVLRYFDLNLGFLILPMLGFIILRLVSALFSVFMSYQAGRVASVFLNAAAFSFLCYFLLNNAALFTRIPLLTGNEAVLNDVSRLASYSVIFFAGFALVQFSYLLTSTSLDRNSAPAFRFLGYIIIGISFWRSSAAFVAYWSSVTDLGLVLFYAMLAVAVSHLGFYGQNRSNLLIVDISGWLQSSPVTKFFWGLFISAYFIFFLPVIASYSPYAHLITWFLVCLMALRIFSNIRNSLQTRYSQPEKETEWEKHIQQVEERIDEDYQLMTLYQSSFIAENDKDVLLSYLIKILRSNHVSDEDSVRMLKPLTEYRDNKTPWFAIGYWRSRIRRGNRQKRQQMLNDLFSGLAEHFRS